MMLWLVILGYLMGWFEPPERDEPDSLSEIPPMYRAEPAVREAEKLVGGRR